MFSEISILFAISFLAIIVLADEVRLLKKRVKELENR